MNINRPQIMSSPRLAGSVKRYHAWPTIQQQTVADHSFNNILIWSQIYGPPSPTVTLYFIWHDLGELVTGDMPFPVKANNPALKRAADDVELAATRAMGAPDIVLTDILRLRVKLCDLCEMLQFGVVECLMGNKFGRPIVDDISKAIEALVPKLPSEDTPAILAYVKGVASMLED